MTRLQRQELLETVARHREEFAAQAPVAPSTAPVWCQGGLQARHVGLRAFAVAAPDGAYEVLPGGLSHAAVHASALNEFFRPGRRHKDVWVLSDEPVAPVSLLHLQPSAVELRRSGNDLPSRVADNLFWLGGHIERAEGLVRQLRICARMTAELEPANLAELAWPMWSPGDDIRLPDFRRRRARLDPGRPGPKSCHSRSSRPAAAAAAIRCSTCTAPRRWSATGSPWTPGGSSAG